MRMTNVFNEDKNDPFNEIQKSTDKHIEAVREGKINHLKKWKKIQFKRWWNGTRETKT